MSSPIEIIPVLDLMGGIVVRGVAGERERYQPNQSRWSDSPDPLKTAHGIRERFGFRRFYIADLDAITGNGNHNETLRQLTESGFELLVDAGIRAPEQAEQCFECGVREVIVGSETLPSWTVLEDLLSTYDPQCIRFSVDLKQGRPWGPLGASLSAVDLVNEVVARNLSHLLLLDVAAVGTGSGVTTLDLCRTVRAAHPGVHLITGGGVRHDEDLTAAHSAGVDALLIASALHDGRLSLPQQSQP
ncbi:MAG: hypothetical protein KDA58_01180 [Planctomycetaceae bacterium]|nr:hypothetical protein [Planctomycetaceae bacterium]